MLVVGIDVGGTNIKFGLVEDGKIIRSMELGTNTFDVVRQLSNGAREIVQASDRAWEEVDGVAVGFPGMVIDSVVLDSPNISLQNCNLKEILEADLGKLVVVRNDGEMATIAEHKLGAGADCENMVLITLGTGVGGGIIANRKMYVGVGGAGEFGHILFEKNGKACSCGRKGCAEQYVSMRALDALAKDIMVGYPNTCVDFNGDGQIYASELVKAYKRNDACSIEIVDKYVDNLTQFVLDLCNLFRPNRIVIGGGITYAPEIIDMVARNARRLDYGYKNSPNVDILSAKLGNQAGILGGYVCIEEELKANDNEEFSDDMNNHINSQNENISLLDSLTRKLDMYKNVPDAKEDESTANNVDALQEESSGMYVNKVLDDISSEINYIKNEQLLGDVEETEDIESDHLSTNLETAYNESVDNDTFVDDVNSANEYSNENNYDSGTEYADNDIINSDIDNVDNNADNADNLEEDIDYDSEENLSLGLNDIFFGTSAELEKKLDNVDISNIDIIGNDIVEKTVGQEVDNESTKVNNQEEVANNAYVQTEDMYADYMNNSNVNDYNNSEVNEAQNNANQSVLDSADQINSVDNNVSLFSRVNQMLDNKDK